MLYIDVSNINGLGARRVSQHIINQLGNFISSDGITLLVSTSNKIYWSRLPYTTKIVQFFGVKSPAMMSLLKVFLLRYRIESKDMLLVLGDYPVFFKGVQILFVQQAHLIRPGIYRYVDSGLLFKVKRFLFQVVSKRLRRIYVQNQFMERSLRASYTLNNCYALPLHRSLPVVPSQSCTKRATRQVGNKIFYPTSGYRHKNNDFFLKVAQNLGDYNLEFRITLDDRVGANLPNVCFLGSLTYSEVLNQYSECDILFFPSQIESLGLPIFEALGFDLLVFLPDLECYDWINHVNIVRYKHNNELDFVKKLMDNLSV